MAGYTVAVATVMIKNAADSWIIGIILLMIMVLALKVWRVLWGFMYTYWWKPWSIRKMMAKQGIRGPTPRFLTGNLVVMTKLRELKVAKDMNTITHAIVDRLMPHYVQWSTLYGRRFIFWWGTEPRLTISEPGLIKELLSAKHGLSYGKSELQQKGVKDFIGKGLLMANGQDWVNHRRIIAPAFHHENLKGHVVHMVESTACLMNKWKKMAAEGNGGAEIEVMEHFMRLAADIIAKTEFGSSYEEGKRVFEKLGLLQKLSSRGGRYSWFPGNGWRKKLEVAKLKAAVEESLQRVVEARRESVMMGRCTSYGNDLLGLMLAECEKGSTKFSTQELMDECKTFFFAGQDTTSTLLTWTTMLLALNPEWQHRAREEVLSLCNGGPPDFSTLPQLKIMGMILNESLRLYTPASLFAKEAFGDMKLGDLRIPKGLSVWIPVLAIHHDKGIWGEDANDFNPERFSHGIAKACNNNPMAFIPFSYGPRKCVGQNFAIMEAKIILAIIISSFKFKLSPSYRHAPISVLTLKPRHGVPIILQPL